MKTFSSLGSLVIKYKVLVHGTRMLLINVLFDQ